MDVIQGECGVVGGDGPRGRVVGLVVAVGIVLLHLAVVLEDVGRQLDSNIVAHTGVRVTVAGRPSGADRSGDPRPARDSRTSRSP